jgi:hypothetical protein
MLEPIVTITHTKAGVWVEVDNPVTGVVKHVLLSDGEAAAVSRALYEWVQSESLGG